jgi:hypothetical protein
MCTVNIVSVQNINVHYCSAAALEISLVVSAMCGAAARAAAPAPASQDLRRPRPPSLSPHSRRPSSPASAHSKQASSSKVRAYTLEFSLRSRPLSVECAPGAALPAPRAATRLPNAAAVFAETHAAVTHRILGHSTQGQRYLNKIRVPVSMNLEAWLA